MQGLLRYFLAFSVLFCTTTQLFAQHTSWRTVHKVKKHETFYGIARAYDITIEELKEANPATQAPDYQLKKGDKLNIPYSKGGLIMPVEKAQTTNTQHPTPITQHPSPATQHPQRPIRLGVMLPLNDKNTDGRRMIEYYRGILMACDSLKKQHISTDIFAWNVGEQTNLSQVLADTAAAQCDLIIGPFYNKQVKELSDFVARNDNRLVIPFSINSPETFSNPRIFQLYQSQNSQNELIVEHYMYQFRNYHPVIVDCGDSTSTKGALTSLLRRTLENEHIAYNITSLRSSDASFLKAFSADKPNIVILNSGKQNCLIQAFGKLSSVSMSQPGLRISMLGHIDWLAFADRQIVNFFKYDVYIPSHFYMNATSGDTEWLTKKYRNTFGTAMMSTLPRFALAGFDHAYYFLRGMHEYGKSFTGAPGMLGHQAVQCPLRFQRAEGGGLINQAFLFVHYTPSQRVEVIRNSATSR